jgi:flagellar basal-body rod modification protein FlgD
MDANGTVVQTQRLGAQEAGVFNFAWDGMTDAETEAPAGVYSFSVEAVRGSDSVEVEALQIGTVSALVRSSNGFQLDLGPLGRVDFEDVQQIL